MEKKIFTFDELDSLINLCDNKIEFLNIIEPEHIGWGSSRVVFNYENGQVIKFCHDPDDNSNFHEHEVYENIIKFGDEWLQDFIVEMKLIKFSKNIHAIVMPKMDAILAKRILTDDDCKNYKELRKIFRDICPYNVGFIDNKMFIIDLNCERSDMFSCA